VDPVLCPAWGELYRVLWGVQSRLSCVRVCGHLDSSPPSSLRHQGPLSCRNGARVASQGLKCPHLAAFRIF
jgi:hypothetical protein